VFLARGLGLVLSLAVAILLANRLGASASTDVFFFARRLVMGSSDAIRKVIANGYIPAFVADIRQHGHRSAARIWRTRFGRLFLLILGGASVVALAAPLLVTAVAPGFSTDAAAEAARLLRILVFIIPLSLIMGALATFLFASRRFGLPEIVGELPRVLTVAALLLLIPPLGVTVLATALLLGAMVSTCCLAAMVWHQVRKGTAAEPAGKAKASQSRGRVLPATLLLIYGQLSLWIAFGFASTLGPGNLSVLEYGIRLMALLPGVLMASFASVVYTELAHRADDGQASARVMRGLRAAAFALVPLVTFIAVSADVLVELVLAHGSFDASDAALTAGVMRFHSPAVVAGVMINILLIGSFTDPKAPHLKLALVAATTGLVLRVAGMMVAIAAFGLVGLPLAASAADVAVLAIVIWMVTRLWSRLFGRDDVLFLGGIGVAAAAAGIGAYLVLQALPTTQGGILLQLAALAAAGGAAAVIYLVATALMRIPELGILREQLPIGRRKKRRAA
jgi:putative peptidoglycan lipid II flippase